MTKVMFLGAVARLNREHGFDGRIGLYLHLRAGVKAKRKSKNHNKGDDVWKLCNMDAVLFKRFLTDFVVADVLEKTGSWAERIIIQMDNAGGHGGGRGDMNETTIAELNEWASDLPEEYSQFFPGRDQPEIVFVTQPARSPDTNVLDLVIWNSLQIAVEKANQQLGLQNITEDVFIKCCDAAWNAWDANLLEQIFVTLTKVLYLIQDAKGGNNYDLNQARKLDI